MRNRLAALLALQLGLVSAPALAEPGFDSVARGGIFDTAIGSSMVGDTLMAQLGGQSAGLRQLHGTWLLQWDVLVAAKGGYLANQNPYLFLLGGHAAAWAEGGARFTPSRAWSPYGGLRLGNEAQIMGHPGAALSDLETSNAVDGVGGVSERAFFRLDAGVSFLDRSRSLLLVLFAQEALRAPTLHAAAQAFTELGFGARFDLSRSLFASLEGVWGVTPKRTTPPGLTDRSTHLGVSATFRKIFRNGMWIGLSASLDRDSDHLRYTETGAAFDTANAPTFAFALLYGFPLWKARP
jgi:hypothetical protein